MSSWPSLRQAYTPVRIDVIGRRLAHYEIQSKLGDGGMGVVYKARDSHLDRFVAIKLLPPEFVADPERKQRFTQEAKAASALNHPGIITIYDITQAEGSDFIAMEYVHGKTLGELIGRKGLRLKDTLSYASQAASALAKAHAAGIVHRDLKPSNIMVTDDGLVKILDFGVAKLTMADAEDNEDRDTPTQTMAAKEHLHTEAGKIVGTVAYMSPEQAEGKNVDARSDIFSFGAVLYEMATGTRAFQGASSVQTLAAVMNDEPKPPSQLASNLPRELELIILRCVRKDPARRFQHMEDLAVELEEIKTDSGTQIAAAQGPARKRRTRWLILSAAVVPLAAVGTWLLWAKPGIPLSPPVVVPLTSLPGDERYPTLSPDGNQIAFAWNGEQGDNQDIYVLSVGAGTPLRLTIDAAEDYAPAWSPDGSQIAFLRRQGPKVAVYLSPPVPGSERKLTEVDDLVVRLPYSWYVSATVSWFPDGKRLVVSDQDGKMAGIVIIPVDHGEPKRLISTAASGGGYHWPTVSPTATLLAYSRCPSDTTFSCDVYVMDLAHDLTVKGAPRRLTTQNATVYGIAWTADGSAIVYGSGVFTRPYLWRVGVAGGEPERLELAGDRAGYPAISGASNRLAYTRFNSGADIWKLDANGPPHPFVSSTLDDRNAQFSPDGKRIAFESNRLGKDSQIWVANSDGTNAAPLNEGAKGVQGSPHWSPDSRSIAFDGQGEDGRQAVYVVDATGGQPQLLASPGSNASWSHDGKWIYFHSFRTGRPEVWRVSVAGGDAVRITDSGGYNPLLPPDGRTLYYSRNVEASALLFALPMGGGPAHQILDTMSAGIHQYFPVDDGIYYIPVRDPKQPFAFEVRFLNFATGKHETLIRFAARSGQGLAVSPERKTILFSGIPISAGDDLMLIRNFR